jgi:hypothetical protein
MITDQNTRENAWKIAPARQLPADQCLGCATTADAAEQFRQQTQQRSPRERSHSIHEMNTNCAVAILKQLARQSTSRTCTRCTDA